ncbi:MAG: protein BatD, partial [Candidatus Tectomicrobia bacterium]|nr:protein BatD [Candidatus Tectomicrobia bacterium]
MWVHSQRPRRVSPWVRPLLVYVCWSLCLCGLLPYAQAAPAVTLQARLAETAIYLGESTSLELRISGIRNPPVPELTHPAIEISSAGGQNFSNSSYSMINGQVRQTEDFGHVARYLLRPHQAGALDIPPIVLVHEGQTYRSNPLTLQVQRPAAQDTLLVEVLISKPSYVLGETVTLTLDLSLRKLVTSGAPLDADPFFREQPPHLQIPWFESLGDWKTTDLKTFAQPFLGNQQRPGFAINDYRRDGMFQSSPLTFTLPRRSSTRTTASGAAEYFTYQLQKHFRPVQTGIQSIPPVTVKANLPTQVDARGRALRTEKFVGSSAPLTVEIRPVPSTGQPASFRGAVGRFQLDVDVNPKILRVGDPLSLSLTLRGEGLLETVHP